MMAICVSYSCSARAQGNNSQGNECQAFENASSPDLLQFLNGVVPDKSNEDCVSLAIRKLGTERYQPAIATLAKFLDFRRPLTPKEKMGFYDHPQGVGGRYPAALALELIGEPALPEVLRAIKADSNSETARENAVAVWMENYKYERPKGVAVQKEEETNTTDGATKQRLRLAISHAVSKWCGPREEAECKAAANPAQH
jgi:hypothetical protein